MSAGRDSDGAIDHFKAFNDNYGHQAGDDCLRRVRKFLAGSLTRSGEVLARYGGEEFVALCLVRTWNGRADRRTPASPSSRVRYRPRHSSTGPIVSLSAGVSAVVPSSEGAPEALLATADAALYTAKRAGATASRLGCDANSCYPNPATT